MKKFSFLIVITILCINFCFSQKNKKREWNFICHVEEKIVPESQNHLLIEDYITTANFKIDEDDCVLINMKAGKLKERFLSISFCQLNIMKGDVFIDVNGKAPEKASMRFEQYYYEVLCDSNSEEELFGRFKIGFTYELNGERHVLICTMNLKEAGFYY